MKAKHLLVAGILAFTLPNLAPASIVYISNRSDNMVGAYDAATGVPVAGWTSPTGLNSPTALAISGNSLYVGNSGIGTVGKYDATTGAAIAGWVSPSMGNPAAITLSGSYLYIAKYVFSPFPLANAEVAKYDTTTGAAVGVPLTISLTNGASAVYGIGLSGNNLFINDGSGVKKYDATTGAPAIGWNPPSGMVWGSGDLPISGNELFFSSPSFSAPLKKIDMTTGAAISGWTSPSFGGFVFGALAVSDNHLYVATGNGSSTVGQYDATTGAPISGWTSPSGLNNSSGIAISNVPEPASIGLLAAGAILLATRRRRELGTV